MTSRGKTESGKNLKHYFADLMDAKDLPENSTSGGVDLKAREFLLQPIKACQPRHKFVTTLQVESPFIAHLLNSNFNT